MKGSVFSCMCLNDCARSGRWGFQRCQPSSIEKVPTLLTGDFFVKLRYQELYSKYDAIFDRYETTIEQKREFVQNFKNIL